MKTKNRRNVRIVLASIFVIIGFLGYSKWHYERANAFYLSYKNGESLAEQQAAFVNNVDPEIMEELNIEVTCAARSSRLYAMSVIRDNKEYIFIPREYSELLVIINNDKNNEELCSLKIENNLKDSHPISGEDEKNFPKYRDEAMEIYRNIFKEVYENWEIK
ncbi:hypothetical protein IGI42_001765 [Enterococcus sp. AZ109]